MKISLSIADLPLNISIGETFALAKKLGFDGVEILPGFKTYSSISQLSKLSQKYNMPILSIHHQFWVGKALLSSRKAFKTANHFRAIIVVHPLKNHSVRSVRQNVFMKKISDLSQEYNVPVGIENMPPQSTLPIYKHFSKTHASTTRLLDVYTLCKKYGFGITLDTSHLATSDIPSLKSFAIIQSLIKNVHLSDYSLKKQHLGLGSGKLNTGKLLEALEKNNYKGLVTLELSPKIFSQKKKYYADIKQSLKLVRKLLSKT